MLKYVVVAVVRALPALALLLGVAVASSAKAAPFCEEPRMLRSAAAATSSSLRAFCPEFPELPPEPEYHASIFAGQSVPTTMVVGQRYNVSVSMRNTGTLVWTAAQNVNLGSQNPGDNWTWGLHRVPTPGSVGEGQTATYNFTVTAPRNAGRYNFQWRMVQDGVTWFGPSSSNVQVNVVGSTIRGNIDGITNGQITGWACSSGINDPIDVHVYLGGAAGADGAVMVGGYRAGSVSEPGVATACGAAGGAYRFYIPIQGDWTVSHANKPIYIHGISPVGAPNLTIGGSGNFRIPYNTPPSVAFTAPAAGVVVAEGGSTLISANASDPDDGVSQVTFLVDGNARATSGAPYQWTYSDIPEGPHTLQVQARDTRGAVTTTPARTIYGSRVIGDTGVANGAIFGWACATHFNGSIPVHLYLGGPYGTGVGYGIATANLGSEPAINNQCKGGGGAYRFSIPITDAMVRDHGGKKIYLHGISPVGGGNNVLANGGTFSVPVNSPPTISLVSPGNVQVESPGEIRLVANASDPDDAVAQVAFYRDGNQVAVVGAAPYEFTVSGLGAGSYRFHAVATDRRGATAISNTHTVSVVRGQSPRAVTRTYVYDGNQRLCKTIEPETGATVVDYDAAGNIAWTASGLDLTDTGACNRAEASASGRRVDRAYDALNRVVRIRFPDRNGDQDLSYRNSGEVQSVTTWNDQGRQTIVNSFQYNKRNLLVGESAASTGRPTWSMGYGYDAQGALASVVYPGGLTVSYANNAQGQPLSVSAGGVSYASGVRYHPTGSVQSFSYGNGIVHATQLNARQLPYQQTDAGAMSYRYSYDAIGNVTGIADLQQGAGFDRTLQYDAGQRLVAAGSASFGGDHWHRYSYDARDNLLSASLGGVKDYRYWYDERNRLANILNADGATIIGLSYDAQGNLRSKNGRVHEFDLGNRLRTIQGLESYQYDAAGRRTVTSDGSGDRLRSFYGQGGQLLYEQRRDGGAAEFIMLGSRLLAKRQGGVVTYQHVDSLGSPVATSNAAGQVTERTQYEPYGQSIGKAIDGVGYTGHVSDAASGLVYMQQRYYDPQIGRFLSVDPVTVYSSPVGAFNRYRYADNSPYNFIDPDGRQAFGHQRSEDIPWWDVTGRVGNWFAETRDLSAQVGFTGDPIAQDALVDQYRAAGDAIVAVQMAALPEFSGAARAEAVVSRHAAVGADKIAQKFFERATTARRIALQTDKFHSFPSAVDAYAARFGQVKTVQDSRGKAVQMLTVRGEMEGSKGTVKGTFEYIKNSNNEIYHRLFRPDGK
ncbi:RHS repeat domain-containing protein [Stenotrophomonas maltophilia]|uniref:RHS repeat domain-containing protein n=1 Tax=Stenotrophomonas maltophilia TaxID=40324 RepID=UPI0013DD1AB9|nr:Ig-like domain-containing protein [Stenotrophomonas maltophilia]HEL5321987.1 hypothetical protein [Stenotrophomonas maltophilia]